LSQRTNWLTLFLPLDKSQLDLISYSGRENRLVVELVKASKLLIKLITNENYHHLLSTHFWIDFFSNISRLFQKRVEEIKDKSPFLQNA